MLKGQGMGRISDELNRILQRNAARAHSERNHPEQESGEKKSGIRDKLLRALAAIGAFFVRLWGAICRGAVVLWARVRRHPLPAESPEGKEESGAGRARRGEGERRSVREVLSEIAAILRGGGEKDISGTPVSKARLHAQRASWRFMAPSLIGVGLFFVLPFFVVIFYSLVNSPVNPHFVGLENFINVLGNDAFRLASWNTFLFSIISVPLAVILSLALASLLMHEIPGRTMFRSFFLTPLMVPVASIILIWQVLFHYNGLINEALKVFGAGKVDWLKSPYAPLAIITLFLWRNLGYNMIMFMAGLASVPQDQIDVARLEGASSAQIFWYVKLRYLASTIMFVIIMTTINSFKVFREIYLLTGSYPFDSLYMLQHFMNNTFEDLDYQKLSSAAILMAIVVALIIYVLLRIEDYLSRDLEG